MRAVYLMLALLGPLAPLRAEEVRLLDLDPPEAQQVIDQHAVSLDYAPKVESNVPAVRYLGDEPHHVLEDVYLAKQYHGQDGLGGYLYGYNVPDIAKTERKKAGGDLRGAYNYVAGNGQEIKVEYWDDGNGFHQIDNVPKILPKQIDDLPEVKAEKDKFLARWHEEAERNSRPVANPFNNEGQYASGPLSAQGQLEAKLQLQQQPNQYQPSGQYQSGQYQQSTQNQPSQPGQYQQTGYNQQSTQYQPGQQPSTSQSGQYQSSIQPGQYQASVQPQQSGGFAGQYQQPGQYQATGQYQQPGQQYQGQESKLNQIDYAGQYSEKQNVYSEPQSAPAQIGGQYQRKLDEIDNSGKYDRTEEEETTGPPKGFFYSFDYPVGIIVQKGDLVRNGELKNVYDENKAKFESQLRSGRSSGSSQSGYLYVKNN